MGKEQAVTDPHGVPTGSVPRVSPSDYDVMCPPPWPSRQVPANTKQIAGDHYKGKGIQPWDYVAANNLGYFEGTAIKYLTRWKDKGGVDDLKKAVHFIEKLIELQS